MFHIVRAYSWPSMIRINGDLSSPPCAQYTGYVPDQSDHCRRSKTLALEASATKTRADCKALQPDPILFLDFHNDTRRAASHTCLFITTQQLSNSQHNSCNSDHRLEIQNIGCWIFFCSNGYFSWFNEFKPLWWYPNFIHVHLKIIQIDSKFIKAT